MIDKLSTFFDKYLKQETPVEDGSQHRLQLAAAVLLVEMLYADDEVSSEEEDTLLQLLQQRFALNDEETRDLLELAHQKKHEATDYFRFTAQLNRHYSQQQKIDLVKNLWQLAYADQRLDKFEEHLVRRLSELLHVPHADFIRTKLEVLDTLS